MMNPLYKLKDEYIRKGTSGIKNIDYIFGALELLAKEKHIFLELDEVTVNESPTTADVSKGPNSYTVSMPSLRSYIITLSHNPDWFDPAGDPLAQHKRVMCALWDGAFREDFQYGDDETMEKMWMEWKRRHYKHMEKYVHYRLAKTFYEAWFNYCGPHAQTVNTQYYRP